MVLEEADPFHRLMNEHTVPAIQRAGFVPTIGVVLALGSVLCLLGFNVLVARRLLQLARAAPTEARRTWPAVERQLPIQT